MTIEISRYMTKAPHTIGAEQPLTAAHELMRKHGVRHLPVLHGGRLVGIVSSRDLQFIETFREVDPKKVLVDDAMSQEIYTTTADSDVARVAREMAERKIGSAVVMDGNDVVGMFTTVDALRALAEVLDARAE